MITTDTHFQLERRHRLLPEHRVDNRTVALHTDHNQYEYRGHVAGRLHVLVHSAHELAPHPTARVCVQKQVNIESNGKFTTTPPGVLLAPPTRAARWVVRFD